MPSLSVTNTFVASAVITAAAHNQNFSDIVTYINNRNSGTAWDSLAVTGNGTIGGTLGVTGNTTIGGNLTVSGSITGISGGDGWISVSQTWTYASASTFTIVGDYTGTYQVGDRVKLTQTTAKYFYITAVSYSAPNTTVTLTAGSDYSLANAAITSPYFSRAVLPYGFPAYFNYTPTITGFSATTTNLATFTVVGRLCTVSFYQSGTSNSTSFSITAPLTCVMPATMSYGQWGSGRDNGTFVDSSFAFITNGVTSITFSKSNSSGTWTNSGTKSMTGNLYYTI